MNVRTVYSKCECIKSYENLNSSGHATVYLELFLSVCNTLACVNYSVWLLHRNSFIMSVDNWLHLPQHDLNLVVSAIVGDLHSYFFRGDG